MEETPPTGRIVFTHPSLTPPPPIPSQTTDSFSLDTFYELYTEAVEANKKLLLAVVRTGSPDDVSRVFHSVYAAHAMNKLLFRRTPGSNRLLSRYDPNRPIAARNPMTNTPIMGEVQYYLVGADLLPSPPPPSNDNHNHNDIDSPSPPTSTPSHPLSTSHTGMGLEESPSHPSLSRNNHHNHPRSASISRPPNRKERRRVGSPPASMGGNSSVSVDGGDENGTGLWDSAPALGGLAGLGMPSGNNEGTGEGSKYGPNDDIPAVFVGTDYHFAQDRSLRALFRANALVAEDAELALDSRGPSGSAAAAGFTPADAALEAQVAQMIERLVRATENAPGGEVVHVPYPRAMMYGMMTMVYVIIASMVIQHGMVVLISADIVPPDLSWYWTLLPFVAYIQDRQTVALFNKKEHAAFVASKLVAWTLFVVLPVIIFSNSASKYRVMRAVFDIVFPIGSIVYTVSTYVYFSGRITLT